ncbi:MAG: hypothetical protein ACOVMN_08460 [Flexibacteraceae bacterium]
MQRFSEKAEEKRFNATHQKHQAFRTAKYKICLILFLGKGEAYFVESVFVVSD